MDLGIDIDTVRAYSLKGILREYSSPGLHYHSCHQVLVIQNGVSLFEEERCTRPLYGTMAALIPAGVPHRSTVIGERVMYESLYFHRNFFRGAGTEIVIFDMQDLGKALLDELNRENMISLDGGYYGQCMRLFFKVLRNDVLKHGMAFSLPVPVSEACRAITGYVHEHYGKLITLASFTSAIPYSTRHISRVFREEMGVTLFEYIRLYRMLLASVKLHTVDARVTDIAYECGYESLSSFFADFKKYFGTSPRGFRAGRR